MLVHGGRADPFGKHFDDLGGHLFQTAIAQRTGLEVVEQVPFQVRDVERSLGRDGGAIDAARFDIGRIGHVAVLMKGRTFGRVPSGTHCASSASIWCLASSAACSRSACNMSANPSAS